MKPFASTPPLSAAMLEKSERQQDPAHPDDETLPGNLRESLPLNF